MFYETPIDGLTVTLRCAQPPDAEMLFFMRSQLEKTRFIHRETGTADDQRRFIEGQLASDECAFFMIDDKEGKVIGAKGLYNLDREAGTVETGRFICYGSPIQSVEALALSFEFAFDVLGVEKVVMSVLADNVNMRKMQERFGVRRTGVEYNNEFGCDSIFSELSVSDYAATKQKIHALVKRFADRA